MTDDGLALGQWIKKFTPDYGYQPLSSRLGISLETPRFFLINREIFPESIEINGEVRLRKENKIDDFTGDDDCC